MDELRGEDIVSIHTNNYGETIAIDKDGKSYFLSWDILCKAMRNCIFTVKKKVTRTHIIDVIR